MANAFPSINENRKSQTEPVKTQSAQVQALPFFHVRPSLEKIQSFFGSGKLPVHPLVGKRVVIPKLQAQKHAASSQDIFHYPAELVADSTLGKEWKVNFSQAGSLEIFAHLLNPQSSIIKTIPSTSAMQHSPLEDIFIWDPALGDLRFDLQNLSDLTALNKEKIYLAENQHNQQMLLAFDGETQQWRLNQGKQWLDFDASNANIKGNGMAFYAINTMRNQKLFNYLNVLHQQGKSAAKKYALNLSLTEAKQSDVQKAKDGLVPNMLAECFLASIEQRPVDYDVKAYLNSEAIELFDALLLHGSMPSMDDLIMGQSFDDCQKTHDIEDVEELLKKISIHDQYIVRIGNEDEASQYHRLYWNNGDWFLADGLTPPKLISHQSHSLTAKGLALFFGNNSKTRRLALFVKDSADKLATLNQYVKDYRYQGSEVAKYNAMQQNPNKATAVKLLDGSLYYDGRVKNYAGLFSVSHQTNLLPAGSSHRWYSAQATSIPRLSQFAPKDPFVSSFNSSPYIESDRFAGMKETCLEQCIQFLEFMYDVNYQPLAVSSFHKRNQVGLSVTDTLQIASTKGLLEPLNQNHETHSFDAGYTEQGVLSWLGQLDKRMPYLVTTQKIDERSKVGSSHIVTLFFNSGYWYVYDNVGISHTDAKGEQSSHPSLERVTEMLQNANGEIRLDENGEPIQALNDKGRALFHDPDAKWSSRNRNVYYNAVDLSRLKLLRTYLNLAREHGENSAELALLTMNEAFRTELRKRNIKK